MKTFVMENRVMNPWHNVEVTDEKGNETYTVHRTIGWLMGGWEIKRDGTKVAQMRALPWLGARWQVQSEVGSFTLSGRLFGFSTMLKVDGGQFDGAIVEAEWSDLSYVVTFDGRTLASAEWEMLSATDRHTMIYDDEFEDEELLALISMVAMQAERMRRLKHGP